MKMKLNCGSGKSLQPSTPKKQIDMFTFRTSAPALRTARLDVQRVMYLHHDESFQNIERHHVEHRRALQTCYCIKIPCIVRAEPLYEVIK